MIHRRVDGGLERYYEFDSQERTSTDCHSVSSLLRFKARLATSTCCLRCIFYKRVPRSEFFLLREIRRSLKSCWRCSLQVFQPTAAPQPTTSSIMRKDIKILSGPTTNSALSAGKIPLLTGEILGKEAYASWLKKSELMNVQNIHRIKQDLRKAIQLLPHYSGMHPSTLCFRESKLLSTVQLVDLDPELYKLHLITDSLAESLPCGTYIANWISMRRFPPLT